MPYDDKLDFIYKHFTGTPSSAIRKNNNEDWYPKLVVVKKSSLPFKQNSSADKLLSINFLDAIY